jgi:osmotically-inducible protein OsmY
MHLDDVAVAAVLVELKWEPTLDASRIRVVATDGVAFLHGTVSTYAEKLAASRSALRASGIRFVHNAIEVDLGGADRITDDDLRLTALQALEWEAHVPDGLVDVQVSDGVVTLRGLVQSPLEIDAAEAAVRRLAGVVELHSELQLGGPVFRGP